MPKKFAGEPFCVLKKIWYRKFSCIGRGHHGSPSKIFSLTVRRKLRGRTLLCFRKFLVWKKLWIRGGYHVFPSENFWSHFTEKLRRGPFSGWQNFGYRKLFCMRWISRLSVRGGGLARVSVDYFMSHSTKNFPREPFSVSLLLGIGKFYAKEGSITIFYQKFSLSQYQKFRRWSLLFQKISGIEKFYG